MAEIRMHTKEELAQMPFGEIVDYINELWDEIVELKRALEGYRNKLDEKEDYIGRLQMQITDMQEEIQKLERFKSLLKRSEGTIEEQRKVIDRYRTEIGKIKEEIKKPHQEEEIKAYCAQDICSMANTVAFHLKMPSVDDGMRYVDYAKHLMRKYEALTDHGFSHDDAMSLIPMWDDTDFKNFKKGT